jgi:hypothetical protein
MPGTRWLSARAARRLVATERSRDLPVQRQRMLPCRKHFEPARHVRLVASQSGITEKQTAPEKTRGRFTICRYTYAASSNLRVGGRLICLSGCASLFMPPKQQHKNAIDDRDTRREPRLNFMCAVRARGRQQQPNHRKKIKTRDDPDQEAC